jgi:hypothetical protein
LKRVSISATLSASARNSEHANSGIDHSEDLPSKGAGAVSINGGGSGSATKGSRGRRRQSQSSTGTAGDVHTESNSIDDYNNDDTPSKRKDREKEKEKNSPTKKAMEVLYKNFSSEFIVAATERRVRFYPKKVRHFFLIVAFLSIISSLLMFMFICAINNYTLWYCCCRIV